MVNKKYLLLAGVCTALALQPAFAQESNTASWSGRDMTYRGQSYDALDTAYVPKGRMQQQMDYLDYKYAFPAKPRNMWELGVSAGLQNIFGDVTSKMPWNGASPLHSLGFGASLRKAIGYATSLRLQYNYQNAEGIDYRPTPASLANNGAWAGYTGNIYANYRYTAHELTLQFVGAINNINFHRAKNVASLYGFVGAGALMYKTKVTNRDKDGNMFDFASMAANGTMTKDEANAYRDELKSNDNTVTVRRKDRTNGRGPDDITEDKYDITPVLVGGIGVQFKLGNRVSLQFEDKISWTGLDNLDGVSYNPSTATSNGDKDVINYGSVGLGFNLGNAKKSVLPLWWVNPLDHIYNELATPRHMKLPDPVLPDSDGDGVTDQFDKCPDTPQGVAVDAHGCPLDTDGDGVPDYKDKQLITPTECQPVDADGVGKCPDPECCKNMVHGTACSSIASGAVSFKSNSAKLDATSQAQLANLAAQMRSNPDCRVVVMGNAGNSKLQQQRSWDRVNAVIEYMSESQSISRDRFIFQYQGGMGDLNSVMYRVANEGEEGPSNLPPPHPQLGTKK